MQKPSSPVQARTGWPRLWLMAALTSAVLTACGGGGTSTGEPPTPFTLLSVTPADAAIDADLTTTVGVQFSAALSSASVTTQSFALRDVATSIEKPGSITFPTADSAQFVPASRLSLAARYHVVLDTTISGAQGESFAGHATAFTTRDGVWDLASKPTNAGQAFLDRLRLGVDAVGNVLVLYQGASGGANHPFATRFDANANAWASSSVQLDTGGPIAGGVTGQPTLAVNAAGDAMAVWSEDSGIGGRRDIWASQGSAVTGIWGPKGLVETNGPSSAISPKVAIDPAGNAFVVFNQGNIVVANRFDALAHAWGTPVPLEVDPDASRDLNVAVDPAGNAVAVWVKHSATADDLYSAQYDSNTGSWGPRQPRSTLKTNVRCPPRLAMGQVGNAGIIWCQNDPQSSGRSAVWAVRLSGGTWDSPRMIDEPTGGDSMEAHLAIGTAMNTFTTFAAWAQNNGIQVNNIDNVGSWGTARQLSTQGALPTQVAADSRGNAFVVWQQLTPGGTVDIWSARFRGDASLWSSAKLESSAMSAQVGIDSDGRGIAVMSSGSGTSTAEIRIKQFR